MGISARKKNKKGMPGKGRESRDSITDKPMCKQSPKAGDPVPEASLM